MKNIYCLLIAVLLTGSLITAASAADESHSTHQKGSHPAANVSPENMKGHHTITGTISQIDHVKGTMSLKTEKETLVLAFPPEEIKDYKEGDKMAVHLAIAKEAEL